jgi:hypothetical protein
LATADAGAAGLLCPDSTSASPSTSRPQGRPDRIGQPSSCSKAARGNAGSFLFRSQRGLAEAPVGPIGLGVDPPFDPARDPAIDPGHDQVIGGGGGEAGNGPQGLTREPAGCGSHGGAGGPCLGRAVGWACDRPEGGAFGGCDNRRIGRAGGVRIDIGEVPWISIGIGEG